MGLLWKCWNEKKEIKHIKRESEGEYWWTFQRTGIYLCLYFPLWNELNRRRACKKVAGRQAKKLILETRTSNPIRAVLLGMGVTAVIQSSSGNFCYGRWFVNSGIMKLSQVVGIIMGANISTTVTSWILSLTGIQSDNFIIRLFKPTSFYRYWHWSAWIWSTIYKKPEEKDVGAIFVGFAILMYGMNAMRMGTTEPLAEVPEFTGMLVKFSQSDPWL